MSSKKIRFFFSFYKAIPYNTETFPPFLISMYLFNSVRKCMVKYVLYQMKVSGEKNQMQHLNFSKKKKTDLRFSAIILNNFWKSSIFPQAIANTYFHLKLKEEYPSWNIKT